MGFFNIFKKKQPNGYEDKKPDTTDNNVTQDRDAAYEAEKQRAREEQKRRLQKAIQARQEAANNNLKDALREYRKAENKIATSGDDVSTIASEYLSMTEQRNKEAEEEKRAKAFTEWCQKQGIDPFNLSGEDYTSFYNRFLTENNGIYIEEGKGEDEGDESILLL